MLLNHISSIIRSIDVLIKIGGSDEGICVFKRSDRAYHSRRLIPDNTAVISFCDPELKHIDKDYSRVDYTSVCDDVFYCEVDDLDLDYLPEKGYTYENFFPEAPELADFINKTFLAGMDIICQCEYGQSRSAGCAAAILEHFYRRVLTFLQITSIIRIRWYITRFLMLWSRQHFSLQNIFSVFSIIPVQSFRLIEMQ